MAQKLMYKELKIIENDLDDLNKATKSEIGKITAFGHEGADSLRYIACEGAEKSRIEFSELFAKIGTSFGSGDGSTTFNLPDLTDQFLRGNSGTRDVGNAQDDTFKNHHHSYVDAHQAYEANGWKDGAPDYALSTSTTRTTNSTGDAETRPKNIAVKYYIRYKG